MHKLPLGPLYYEYSRHNEPRITIESGDSVEVEAEAATQRGAGEVYV